MEGPRVQHKLESITDACRPKVGGIAVEQRDVHAGLTHSFAGTGERLLDDVDARHLPASLCEQEGPDAAAGSEVQRRSEGRLASALLPGDQLGELVHERGLILRVLPRMKAKAVGELVVHAPIPRHASGSCVGTSVAY